MKILCDEDLPHKLREHLPGDVFTVAYMGWGGLKNGELLKAAEDAGFDVLVTGDQSMADQQDLSGRKLALVMLSAIEWPIIKNQVEKIAAAVLIAGAGRITRVDVGRFVRRRKPSGPEPL